MNPRRRQTALLLACTIFLSLACYLIGNGSVSLWDRDEPRYAQTSRQMLASGDWVVPMLLDEPREKKPIFIYWCQAASMAVFRFNEVFAARLPSAIGVTLTLLVFGGVLWRTVGSRRALWTTFIFASSALALAAAKMCITDGVLILWVTISQLCLYAFWQGRRDWLLLVTCGLSIGLGLLTKGPVVPAVMAMTLVALGALRWIDRKRDEGRRMKDERSEPDLHRSSFLLHPSMRLFVAAVLAIGVYCTWGIPIERRLPGYHVRTIQAEVLERAAKPQEGHRGPPGFYLLTIWGTYLPWSILLPATIASSWKRRHLPQIRFALAAVIGPWLMFEIVQTKLVHYLLPVFPALSFLTADVVVRSGRLRKLGAILGITMLIVVAVAYGLVLPRVQALRISNNVAGILISEGATQIGDAIMIDYKEMSLAFYQGGTIRPQRDNKFLEKTPPEHWPRWIVLTTEIWRDTPEAIRQEFDVIGSAKGLNYAAGGRFVEVLVLRKRTSPAIMPP